VKTLEGIAWFKNDFAWSMVEELYKKNILHEGKYQ